MSESAGEVSERLMSQGPEAQAGLPDHFPVRDQDPGLGYSLRPALRPSPQGRYWGLIRPVDATSDL